MIHVTANAIQRYQECIDPTLTRDEARARIEASSPAIECACRFGAEIVRQACGARLLVRDNAVITIKTRRKWRHYA